MARGHPRIALAAGLLLMASAAGAQTAEFSRVEYLAGVPGLGRQSGTLSIVKGELRFHDRRGHTVFERPLAFAEAWHAYEKRTSGGCVVRNIALLAVFVPLMAAYPGDPWVGGCTSYRPALRVRVGTGGAASELRLRVRDRDLHAIIDAVNHAAWYGWSPDLVPHL